MLTKTQLNLLNVFRKDIFAGLTFKQIKERSGQKSNSTIQMALSGFRKEGLVKPEVVADVTVYRLNLESSLLLSYLNLMNEIGLRKFKLPFEVLSEINKKLSKQTEFFILAVFGSHAKGVATDKSDLDVALIVESDAVKKEMTPLLETVKRREIKHIDYHLFTRAEFIDMLSADYENLGKQIYKNSIIINGYIEYCRLIGGVNVGRRS